MRALEDFANTQNSSEAIAYTLKRHHQFLDKVLAAGLPALHQRLIWDPLSCTFSVWQVATIEPATRDYTFRYFRDLLRAAWNGQGDILAPLLFAIFNGERENPNFVRINWQKGDLSYEPRTDFQAAVYQLLKHSRLAKVCANPECASFFIADKAQTRYCSNKCAGIGFRISQQRHYEAKIKPRREKERREKGRG